MLPKTIFLDMDDCLNTFTLSALKEVGCPVEHKEYDKYDPIWKFNVVDAANALHPNRTFSYRDFWESLGPAFWATIPKSTECSKLLEQCGELVGGAQVCILTNPVQIWQPYVAAAKMEWISHNLPGWLHRQFLIGPVKHLCARPDALLIDDSDENCKNFRIHGGQAILVPRPWNCLHFRDTKHHLQLAFRALLEEKNVR